MRRRIKHALDWRLRAVVGRLDRLSEQVERLQATLDDEVRPVLRVLAAEESSNRRRLFAARAAPAYADAWTDPDPLVSITVATRDRPGQLLSRAMPSLLAQTHRHLEVVVVGDDAAPEVAQAVTALDDPRVRWANLSQRVEAHPDAHRRWLVGSAMARNEAQRLARGAWLLHFDDDDSLHADAIELLLARARETRAEVAYGGFVEHAPGGATQRHQRFPPSVGDFGWQGALHHAGLPFARELVAAPLGVPGDMWLLERMLRSGVRFAMVDRPVWDYFPSTLWEGRPT